MIHFEAWAILAQQGLACLIQLTRVNAVGDNIIITICAIWPTERAVQCQKRSSLGQWYTI